MSCRKILLSVIFLSIQHIFYSWLKTIYSNFNHFSICTLNWNCWRCCLDVQQFCWALITFTKNVLTTYTQFLHQLSQLLVSLSLSERKYVCIIEHKKLMAWRCFKIPCTGNVRSDYRLGSHSFKQSKLNKNNASSCILYTCIQENSVLSRVSVWNSFQYPNIFRCVFRPITYPIWIKIMCYWLIFVTD